jgi:chorismate dehydratase
MSEETENAAEPLRIGAVSYLNTKPLVEGLEELLPAARLSFDYPSRLADLLAARELDIALVPAIELARRPEWQIVSDACIACRGPVLSVKVLFRVPPVEVRSLALDEGSRTSAVLAQVLLDATCGVRPELAVLPLGAGYEDATTDAVLLIGDRAIRDSRGEFVEVWDLGDRWCRWAELPFVFAVWAARAEVEVNEASLGLGKARDLGCERIAAIARREAAELQLPLELVEEYLGQNLYFRLGPKERRGLALFYQRAASLGLIDTVPQVELDDCSTKN